MSAPTILESRAAYVGKKVGRSGKSILLAMMEWSKLSSEEKASYEIADYEFWTEEELAILNEYWGGGRPPDECLEALPGRTYASITKTASKHNIRRPNR